MLLLLISNNWSTKGGHTQREIRENVSMLRLGQTRGFLFSLGGDLISAMMMKC